MNTLVIDEDNEMFRAAWELVVNSDRNVFLTGRAGTGKTTFLKQLRERCQKQMAILAPTGVAAINAGGVTIHSFLQLPLVPYLPEGTFSKEECKSIDRHGLISRLRFNRDKIKVLRNLELMIIDEISMVRADTLDAVDVILKHVRRRPTEQFGGVQVLLIGDLMQLTPVAKSDEWDMLKAFYASPYFFDSRVLRQAPPLFIEFNKIYRQKDEKFIHVLNLIRNNQWNEECATLLEQRYMPDEKIIKDGYIVLTTHNEKARLVNEHQLSNLKGKAEHYEAKVEGEFQDKSYPADANLVLKPGAQVMFIRNDSSEKGKRFYNGKVGTVKALFPDRIEVVCDGEEEIEVKREKWENIRYTTKTDNGKIEQLVMGSFSQFPLRLAWAVTIHKSQGLTFDKVIIDAGSSFAPGQVYVALSRCTSLEGIILQTRIHGQALFSDERVTQYYKQQLSSDSVAALLKESRKNYQVQLVWNIFNVEQALHEANEIRTFVKEHKKAFTNEHLIWIDQLIGIIQELQQTSTKFYQWLRHAAQSGEIENETVRQKITSAISFYTEAFQKIRHFILACNVVSDSRPHASEFSDQLKEIFFAIELKLHLIGKNKDLLNTESLFQTRNNFRPAAFPITAYSAKSGITGQSMYPELYARLKAVRDRICDESGLAVYMVASSTSLYEMTQFLPTTLQELKKIKGFGEAKARNYGQQFLDEIVDYAQENNLRSTPVTGSKRERKKSGGSKSIKLSTNEITYQLFRQGKSVEEIADERQLKTGTIYKQLADCIEEGILTPTEILGETKTNKIAECILNNPELSLTELRQKLNEEYSFEELRLVKAGMKLTSGS